MRLSDRFLLISGVLALVAALAWALADDSSRPAQISLAVIGLGIGAADVALWVIAERAPDGLAVPPGTSLPAPAWFAPLAVLAVLGFAVAGVTASALLSILAGVTALLALAGMLAWARTSARRPSAGNDAVTPRPSRRTVVLARRVRRLAGESGHAYLAHIALGRAKLVVAAADGTFGDIVTEAGRAEEVVALAGLELDEPGDLAFSALRTGRPAWLRMAG